MRKEEYPETPVEINDSDFDTLVKKYPLVIVDLWAPWCPPCRILGPVIESIAKKYAGRIVFAKLNVDKNERTPAKYGVMSVPTLLVFKNGKLIDRIVGAMPESVLESRIRGYV